MSPLLISVIAAAMVISLVAIVGLLLSGNKENVDDRLEDLRQRSAPSTARVANFEKDQKETAKKRAQEKLKDFSNLMGADDKELSKVRAQLVQAGLYNPASVQLFMTAKLICIAVPIGIAIMLALTNVFPAIWCLVIGAIGGLAGMAAPGMWLGSLKTQRQTQLRRSLPDAMDVIVICMEGGLSLPAALARVGAELKVAHPLLASELNICQREITLGKTTGEALKDFSRRADMEEIRSLSGVIAQAEKYGASLAQALRIHAESLRLKRSQRAQELAHQAGTKIMFPTLLFIFPAIFVVILGPAIIRIMEMFANL